MEGRSQVVKMKIFMKGIDTLDSSAVPPPGFSLLSEPNPEICVPSGASRETRVKR
jgi:hypothetical protein